MRGEGVVVSGRWGRREGSVVGLVLLMVVVGLRVRRVAVVVVALLALVCLKRMLGKNRRGNGKYELQDIETLGLGRERWWPCELKVYYIVWVCALASSLYGTLALHLKSVNNVHNVL